MRSDNRLSIVFAQFIVLLLKSKVFEKSINNNDCDFPILVESSFACPDNEGGADKTIFLPHEYDCTKYYVCNQGTPMPFDCGPGTHFNPRLEVCVHPDTFSCVGGGGGGDLIREFHFCN